MVCTNLSYQRLQLLNEEAEWISEKFLRQLKGRALHENKKAGWEGGSEEEDGSSDVGYFPA